MRGTMRSLAAALLCLSGMAGAAPSREAAEIMVDTARPGVTIDPNIYGQFVEHLGRGVYGGIWVGPDSPIPNVAHDKSGYIRQAASRAINGGYAYDPAKVDPESVGTEAPMLWGRHGTDTYVLMYDVFGAKPNNMGFSETRDFIHFKDIGHFNDPGSPMKATNFSQPKHGAVIPVSPAEGRRLLEHFKAR